MRDSESSIIGALILLAIGGIGGYLLGKRLNTPAVPDKTAATPPAATSPDASKATPPKDGVIVDSDLHPDQKGSVIPIGGMDIFPGAGINKS